MFDLYLQQLEEICSCMKCVKDEDKENALQQALDNWNSLTCNNYLLNTELSRVFPLSADCDSCCPRIMEFTLFETWLKPETINLYVRVWEGLESKELVVPFVYDEMTEKVMVDLTNVQDCCNSCERYELVVIYEVGIDELPDELIPLFCEMMKLYIKIKEIECSECGEMDSVAIIEVDGTIDLTASIKRLAIAYYQRVVEKYSLCLLDSLNDWTVIGESCR